MKTYFGYQQPFGFFVLNQILLIVTEKTITITRCKEFYVYKYYDSKKIINPPKELLEDFIKSI